jgi:hypothetical protein
MSRLTTPVNNSQHNVQLTRSQLRLQARKNAASERMRSLVVHQKDLSQLAEIGSGRCSTVLRGTWQRTIDVAVKQLHVSVLTERAKHELGVHADVARSLQHPNVAVSYGVVLEPRNCALVMKHYGTGTLLELLHDDAQPLPLTRKLQVGTAGEQLQCVRHVHFLLRGQCMTLRAQHTVCRSSIMTNTAPVAL